MRLPQRAFKDRGFIKPIFWCRSVARVFLPRTRKFHFSRPRVFRKEKVLFLKPLAMETPKRLPEPPRLALGWSADWDGRGPGAAVGTRARRPRVAHAGPEWRRPDAPVAPVAPDRVLTPASRSRSLVRRGNQEASTQARVGLKVRKYRAGHGSPGGPGEWKMGRAQRVGPAGVGRAA